MQTDFHTVLQCQVRVEQSLLQNPQYFWRFVKDMRNTGTIPDCMHFGSESALNGQEISNLFAKHFSEVYVDTDCPDPQLPIKNLGQISIRNVSFSEMFTKIGSFARYIFLWSGWQCVYTVSNPL
mgnify:CR=1 FL=1